MDGIDKSKDAQEIQRNRTAESILRSRVGGLSLLEIAEAHGISRVRASQILDRELAESAKRRAGARDQLLDLELLKLDRCERGLWDSIDGGDEKAVNAFVRISEHRSKLLGLYLVAPLEDGTLKLTVPGRELWQPSK